MVRWTRGEADVEALIAAGDLQKLTGEAANGERLLKKATTTLTTARSAIESDPDSAFVLAYDAARQALTAGPAADDQGWPLRRRAGRPSAVRSGVPTVRRAAPTPQRAGVPRATW
ncbi:hypothetical protein GCM10027062_25840 [Nocardioides hungaricus]